jgi:tetratricopeptide (TPR) repeat protein
MQEAIDLSKTAVDVNPDFSPALAAYGYNLGINGRLDEGIGYLKKATVANPRISQNYYYIGVLYRSVKEYDQAKKYQEEGLSKIDNDNTILGKEYKAKIKGNMSYDLAKTYSLLNENRSVISLLEQAVSLNPALKQTLINDFNYQKLFQSFKTEQKFLALIK